MKNRWKKLLFSAAACGIITAAALPFTLFSTRAAEGFVAWKAVGKKDGKYGVEISLQLMEEEIFEESATFWLTFQLTKGM